MRYSVETDFKLFLRNMVQYRWWVATLFSVIALTFTGIGYFKPNMYASYSTLLFDARSQIAPLLADGATAQGNPDWAKVAKEILHSRKTMTSLMQALGEIDDKIETVEQEVRLEKLKANTKVSMLGESKNYIKVEFRDPDPAMAKEVATRLTDIFIDSTHGYQAKESGEAFEFIDEQVKTYHKKLLEAEERLKRFKSDKLSKGVGSEAAVSGRIERLQLVIDQAELDLKEELIRKASLERQLQGEVKATVSLARQSQYVEKLELLQNRLAKLRLDYTETYPEIIAVKRQIEDVRRQIDEEKRGDSMDLAGIDIKANKVYQDIRLQLADTRTRIATLQTRIEETRANIEAERKKGTLVNENDAQLAELTRDYEVNKQLYESLLKRRESARFDKEVDDQHKGLNIKIDQPAFLPTTPTGFRFIHFVLAGLLLGLLTPAALVYLYQIVDGTVKSPELVQARLNVPVLGAISAIANDKDLLVERRLNRGIRLRIWLTFIIIAIVGYLRVSPDFLK